MIARRTATSIVLSTCALLLACTGDSGGDSGSSTADTTDAPATGTDTTLAAPTTGQPDTTGPGDTTSSTSTDSTGASDSTGDDSTTTASTGPVDPGTGTDTSTGGTDTSDSSTSDSSTSDSSTGDSSTGEPSEWDGEPLPLAPEGEWIWVDVPEAKCRDGSSTGIGVRYGSGDGLVIYFQSGGACYNAATCGNTPKNFGPVKFANFMGLNGEKGIFDPQNPQNPVGDWSYVFVPYCTGDVHAGAQPNGKLDDVQELQQFVGYLNLGHYLERVVPTFVDDAQHVLVTGESAGGFGSLFNYDRIATAFPERPVTLLDDSGPILPDQFMTSCLQVLWRTAWALDQNLPADCSGCFPQDGGGLTAIFSYLADKYPEQSLGLVSSLGDASITYFFEFGLNACQGGTLPPADFAAGLAELRDVWMTGDVWGTYYPSGTQHTWLLPSFYTTQIDGVSLTEWLTDLLAGEPSHVSG